MEVINDEQHRGNSIVAFLLALSGLFKELLANKEAVYSLVNNELCYFYIRTSQLHQVTFRTSNGSQLVSNEALWKMFHFELMNKMLTFEAEWRKLNVILVLKKTNTCLKIILYLTRTECCTWRGKKWVFFFKFQEIRDDVFFFCLSGQMWIGERQKQDGPVEKNVFALFRCFLYWCFVDSASSPNERI